MAEWSVTGTERDFLPATKLYLPGPRPGQVPRPRLLARLDDGLARGVELVCAPAGYGKTVLLADWSREHPAAGLSLDAEDNDPARFWRHAAAALDRARPGIAERVAPLLGPPAPSSFQGLVTAAIRPGHWRRSPRPNRPHQVRRACSTRSPPSGPGCC